MKVPRVSQRASSRSGARPSRTRTDVDIDIDLNLVEGSFRFVGVYCSHLLALLTGVPVSVTGCLTVESQRRVLRSFCFRWWTRHWRA